jgi:hypothetical protein
MWFWFAFPWWQKMVNIFSWIYSDICASFENCVLNSLAHFLKLNYCCYGDSFFEFFTYAGYLLAVLGFEIRVACLLGKHLSHSLFIFNLANFWIVSHTFFPRASLRPWSYYLFLPCSMDYRCVSWSKIFLWYRASLAFYLVWHQTMNYIDSSPK